MPARPGARGQHAVDDDWPSKGHVRHGGAICVRTSTAPQRCDAALARLLVGSRIPSRRLSALVPSAYRQCPCRWRALSSDSRCVCNASAARAARPLRCAAARILHTPSEGRLFRQSRWLPGPRVAPSSGAAPHSPLVARAQSCARCRWGAPAKGTRLRPCTRSPREPRGGHLGRAAPTNRAAQPLLLGFEEIQEFLPGLNPATGSQRVGRAARSPKGAICVGGRSIARRTSAAHPSIDRAPALPRA